MGVDPPIPATARAWLGPSVPPGRAAPGEPRVLGSTADFERPWDTANRLLFKDPRFTLLMCTRFHQVGALGEALNV